METLWAQKNRESRCLKVPGSSYNAKEYFDQGKPVSFLVPKIGKLLFDETRKCFNACLASLLKKLSIRLSHEACFGVKVKLNRPGFFAKNAITFFEV